METHLAVLVNIQYADQGSPDEALEEYREIDIRDPDCSKLADEIDVILGSDITDGELAELAARLGQYSPIYEFNYREYLKDVLQLIRG